MPNLAKHSVNCRIATIMNEHIHGHFPLFNVVASGIFFTAHISICSVLPSLCVEMGPAPLYQILPNTNQGAHISSMLSASALSHWHNAWQ